MSIPLPPINLEGHCSAVVDDTLYVLSPGGFQSLPLKKHARWKKEANGVKVTGPACVTVTPNGDESQASLWVIGGTTDDNKYDGIQVYSFAKKSWQTITSPVPLMQGRVNHSVAYLEDSKSILVYAGAQEKTTNYLSSETFVLPTEPPYVIQSYTSNAPPANIPILQPWDTDSAVMVGGSTLNKEVSIFSIALGWQRLGVDLLTPLNPRARGTLINGDDGSKVLEVYDMNVSPNTVTQIVLLGAGGGTARTGQIIGNNTNRRPQKRALTLNDWPPYHQHLAPTAQRDDFSVVQDSKGVAVISGGNNKVPVALFNQESNAWIDADNFFSVKNQQPLKPTSTRHTSSPTSSSSSSPTLAPGSSGEDNHARTLKVLGIILGVLFGIAFLFVLILFWLRIKKIKKREREGWIEEKNHERRQTSPEDRAGSFLKETGATANTLPPPIRPARNSAHNSLAIITGKFNRRSGNRGGHVQQHSNDSTAQLVKNKEAGFGMAQPMELADINNRPDLQRRMTPRLERGDRPPSAVYGQNLTAQDAHAGNEESARRANRNRSSGWSKYFATSAPVGPNGLGHIPSGYVRTNDEAARALDRDPSQHSGVPSSSVVPPLVEAEPRRTIDGQPVVQVAMGSPAFNDSRDDLAKRGSTATEGQTGLIVDPNRRSDGESISSYNRSATSSARNSDYQEQSNWTPTANNSFKDHINSAAPSADAYNRVPSRGKSSHFFPGAGTSFRPSKSPKMDSTRSGVPATSTPWTTLPKPMSAQPADARGSNMTIWPGHRSNPSADYSKPAEQRIMATTNSALPQPPGTLMGPQIMGMGGDNRGSNATVFPAAHYPDHRGERSQDPAKPVNSDLAWLNLGLNGSQNRF